MPEKNKLSWIEKYIFDQTPDDQPKIKTPIAPPKFKQVETLRKYIQARDILVVWSKLAKELDSEEDVFKDLDSSEAYIEKAKMFAEWMRENHDKLPGIEFLDLSSNQLSEIPAELGQLSSLTDLLLQHNNLTGIPKELGNLSNLAVLDLRVNQLTEIPKGDIVKSCGLALSASSHFSKLPVVFHSLLRHL